MRSLQHDQEAAVVRLKSSPLAARRASPLLHDLVAVGSQITAASSLPARKLVVITSMFWLR